MILKGDTTENYTLRVTGSAWTGSTMSPKDVVDNPLNPDRIRPGFSRPVRLCPMWLTTDACTRSVELPGSTKMRLTSKSPISRDKMRVSRCGCSVRVGSTGGKMIVPSMGRGPPLVNPGRMELICSRIDAARNNFCLFRLESYSSSDGPPLMREGQPVWATWPFLPSSGRPWSVRRFSISFRATSRCLSGNQDLMVAARTSSSSIEYLLARLNKVLMFCLCRAEHKYCPTKASDKSLKLPTELGGGFFHLVVPLGVSERSAPRGSRCGSTFCATRVTIGSGRVAPDILILVLALSLLLGPLNADDDEALMLKPGYIVPRFLLLIFLSPRGELSVVVCLPTVFFRWLGAIQNYLPLSYQMNGFGKSFHLQKASGRGIRTHPPMVLSAMVKERDKSVGLLLGIVSLPSPLCEDGEMWVMAGCCDNVQDLLSSVNDPDKHTRIVYVDRPDALWQSSGCYICECRVPLLEGVRIGKARHVYSWGNPDESDPDDNACHVS
uniref:Uncharacterized protein n=1 Tax=Vitis vinifera TaxID=29760 RepID=A5B567_VITVI|nr:hypothetical protein VITISV_013252 [Vitis vinifera]